VGLESKCPILGLKIAKTPIDALSGPVKAISDETISRNPLKMPLWVKRVYSGPTLDEKKVCARQAA
jgi:hypothetical protein